MGRLGKDRRLRPYQLWLIGGLALAGSSLALAARLLQKFLFTPGKCSASGVSSIASLRVQESDNPDRVGLVRLLPVDLHQGKRRLEAGGTVDDAAISSVPSGGRDTGTVSCEA